MARSERAIDAVRRRHFIISRPSGREDSMTQLINTLWQDESGQDLAEYGLLLALVAVVVATAIIAFRDQIVAAFTDATNVMADDGTGS